MSDLKRHTPEKEEEEEEEEDDEDDIQVIIERPTPIGVARTPPAMVAPRSGTTYRSSRYYPPPPSPPLPPSRPFHSSDEEEYKSRNSSSSSYEKSRKRREEDEKIKKKKKDNGKEEEDEGEEVNSERYRTRAVGLPSRIDANSIEETRREVYALKENISRGAQLARIPDPPFLSSSSSSSSSLPHPLTRPSRDFRLRASPTTLTDVVLHATFLKQSPLSEAECMRVFGYSSLDLAPWRVSGADLTQWFNHGWNEYEWYHYSSSSLFPSSSSSSSSSVSLKVPPARDLAVANHTLDPIRSSSA